MYYFTKYYLPFTINIILKKMNSLKLLMQSRASATFRQPSNGWAVGPVQTVSNRTLSIRKFEIQTLESETIAVEPADWTDPLPKSLWPTVRLIQISELVQTYEFRRSERLSAQICSSNSFTDRFDLKFKFRTQIIWSTSSRKASEGFCWSY